MLASVDFFPGLFTSNAITCYWGTLDGSILLIDKIQLGPSYTLAIYGYVYESRYSESV